MRPLHTVNYAGSCGRLPSKRAFTAHSQSVRTLAVKLFHGFTLNLALRSSCLFGNLINSTGRSQHSQLRGRLMSSNAKFVTRLLSRHTIQIKLQPLKPVSAPNKVNMLPSVGTTTNVSKQACGYKQTNIHWMNSLTCLCIMIFSSPTKSRLLGESKTASGSSALSKRPEWTSPHYD